MALGFRWVGLRYRWVHWDLGEWAGIRWKGWDFDGRGWVEVGWLGFRWVCVCVCVWMLGGVLDLGW